MPKKGKHLLPRSECLCSICREILLEPVTLPCKHTLCHLCFKMTVEKASLCCPFCRQRVSTWARHNTRSGTLVNKEMWEVIQRQYPEECKRRACGQDAEEDEFEDGFTSYPAPLLCKPGEIRQEYEAAINKIEADRLSREEKDRKASEEYIQKLLEEEERQLCLGRRHKDLEEQLKRDEEMAWMLNNDLNESTQSADHVLPVESPVIHKPKVSSKSSKDVKGKMKHSGDIERFLSPTRNKTIGIQGSDQAMNADVLNISSGMESNTSALVNSDDDSMPTLSPETSFPATDRPMQESDSELLLPSLTKYSPNATDQDGLQAAGPSRSKDERNKELSHTAAMALSPPRSSSFQDGYGKWTSSECNNVITSTPEQWLKKALDSSGDVEDHGTEKKRKVSYLESSTVPGSHTERLMDLEETLNEKKIQEDQDRLLALKLQKVLDKELKHVSRQKGSPDAYKLRPKQTAQQQDPVDVTPLKRPALEDSMSQTKAESLQSDTTPDENQKPAPKKRAQHHQVIGSRAPTNSVGSSSPIGVKVLRPSNKQRTILDMFERSSRK